jgi:CoA:oxalate CoA-transferase
MNRPDLADDARFAKPRARAANHLQLAKIIEEWLASFPTRDDALAALDKERVPCAPVLTVNEAMAHPHLNQRKTVRWVDDPLLGRVAIPGIPVKFSAWPDRMQVRAARLGEDNEQVLREYLNLNNGQIHELYQSGVLVRDSTLGPNPVGE